MDNSNKLQQGTLKVSDDVIATIARLATSEVDGVEGLTKASVSFKQMFVNPGKNGSIKIKLAGDVVEISISVIVKFGNRVTTVAEHIQNRVKADVQNMTGVTVSRVNVSVAGIVFDTTEKN